MSQLEQSEKEALKLSRNTEVKGRVKKKMMMIMIMTVMKINTDNKDDVMDVMSVLTL